MFGDRLDKAFVSTQKTTYWSSATSDLKLDYSSCLKTLIATSCSGSWVRVCSVRCKVAVGDAGEGRLNDTKNARIKNNK